LTARSHGYRAHLKATDQLGINRIDLALETGGVEIQGLKHFLTPLATMMIMSGWNGPDRSSSGSG
jgi:hypothetical protein